MALAHHPQVHAHEGRHPDGETDRRSPVTKQRTSDRNPGQDDPDATGVLDLHPGPDMGCQPRIRPSGHRKMRPPETVHFPFPGITLIDEEVRENARGSA
jgi:hypothetical protein